MNYKELDISLGRCLTGYFVQNAFSGRGHQTARRWERDAINGDARHVIVTPCAPVRTGGGVVSCGVGIRFETIETELAQLTAGSICFRPSGDTSTIGAALEKIVEPDGDDSEKVI